MDTATTTRRRQSRLGSVDPLPPELLPLATERVRDTSQAFAASLERRTSAGAELAKARAEVEAAGLEDRHAATAAEHGGNKLPQAKLPKAEESLAEAERRAAGAEEAAQVRQNEFQAALLDDLATLTANAEAAREQAADDAAAHVQAVEDAMVRRVAAGKLLHELGDGRYLMGRSAVFKVGRSRRQQQDPLAGPLRHHLDRLRGTLGIVEGADEAAVEHRTEAWQ